MYPDFLIIGAQKAGTTWLHRNLGAHPGIWLPKEKELHYFDEKLGGGPSLKDKLRGDTPADQRWRRQLKRQYEKYRKDPKSIRLQDLAWDLRYFLMPPNDAWYASLFEPGKGKITGEATPDYSVLDKEAVAHVHKIMPEAKIIFMLRNPIERAWSQALMDFSRWGPIEDVADKKFFRQFGSRRSRLFSDYARTLENWGSYYPPEQIFVCFIEDVHFLPGRLLRDLYRFLGAEESAKYRVIKRKIHTRSVETMPKRLARRLARIYGDDVAGLDERFGGYASFWLYCVERLLADRTVEGDIPYPLWESPLWADWVKESGAPAPGSPEAGSLSGPLSSLLAAS